MLTSSTNLRGVGDLRDLTLRGQAIFTVGGGVKSVNLVNLPFEDPDPRRLFYDLHQLTSPHPLCKLLPNSAYYERNNAKVHSTLLQKKLYFSQFLSINCFIPPFLLVPPFWLTLPFLARFLPPPFLTPQKGLPL